MPKVSGWRHGVRWGAVRFGPGAHGLRCHPAGPPAPGPLEPSVSSCLMTAPRNPRPPFPPAPPPTRLVSQLAGGVQLGVHPQPRQLELGAGDLVDGRQGGRLIHLKELWAGMGTAEGVKTNW